MDVAFLDMRRLGDRLTLERPGELFDIYCPPERSWFSECAQIVRACDTVQTCVKYKFGVHGLQCVEVGEVSVNCYFACEQFVWEERTFLAIRPPFPPLPRAVPGR